MDEQTRATLQEAAFSVFRANVPVSILTIKEILGNETPVSGDALARARG